MPRLKRRQISDAIVRRALARLEPPNDTMLLDAETIKVSRKLDALLKRRGYDSRAIQHLLDEFASSLPPVMHTLGGGGFGFSLFDRRPVSLFKILEGLYLPTDTDSWLVPSERRYFDNQTRTGTAGSASAYKNNGKLTTIQSVNLTASQESAWAGVYIKFYTDPAEYGQVNRITFEPNIDWTYRDWQDSNAVWLVRASGWQPGNSISLLTNSIQYCRPRLRCSKLTKVHGTSHSSDQLRTQAVCTMVERDSNLLRRPPTRML